MKYYCGVWESRSHILVPLTKIAPTKVKCKLTTIKQDDFDEIKQIVACDTLLAYTDFNESFKIQTNASNFQLGAAMS